MRAPARLRPTDRLKRLLSAGYLPEEMPPPFISTSFAHYRAYLGTQWRRNRRDFYSFKSAPEPFSVPKYGHKRKNVVIVNPVNQFRVAELISDNWDEVRNHISQSQITEFRPIIDREGPRSIFNINFRGVDESEARIRAEYWHALRTDISRFYGSVYTHSIGWALHDKATIQIDPNANWFTSTFAHRLDIAVRRGQNNQSVGIPIGPDTSRIISEIIAVSFEGQLAQKIADLPNRSVRYVDDMIIGFDENESEDSIISSLKQSLAYFELEINFEKTSVTGHRAVAAQAWIHDLRSVTISRSSIRQREQIERFFNIAVVHSDKSDQDSVLKWAIKRSRSFRINDENFSYYVDILLGICRRAPACFRAAAQIIIEANHRSRPLPRERIKKFIVDHIRVHSAVGHAFEVSWSLFLAKGLRINLDRSEVETVFTMESSACALLTMDLNRLRLITGGINDTYWLRWANADGLKSSMWLVAYEAAQKRWWSTGVRQYVEAHTFFGPMCRRGIHFYDTNRNVPPSRREAQEAVRHAHIERLIFSRWEEYF